MFTKDKDFFYSQFKIEEYIFNLHHYDTNTELLINNKKFLELMKEERSGILDKEKQNYLRQHKNNNESNNDYFLAGENYDIKEQKRLLEEFERKKKKEKEKVKSFYISDEQSDFPNNQNKNKFILDDKTVNKNRLIICNIQNIFDNDNEEDEFNFSDFNWENTSYNPNQINNTNKNKIPNSIEGKYEKNININFNQINNNINNQHNQEVINQFFDFTKNNMSGGLNSQYPNLNNNNNVQNNKYDDDFNPFLD